jgi:hypothetical protein
MQCKLGRITDVADCNEPAKIWINTKLWHRLCFLIRRNTYGSYRVYGHGRYSVRSSIGERVCSRQPHLRTHEKLVEPCSESGRIFLRDHLTFKVSVSQCHGAVKKPTGISDRNSNFYPPSTDIQFNFRRFVNKVKLKIKEHWTINIVDYIPEIIRSIYGKINS